MNTNKYVVALAMVFSTLLTVQASNVIDLDSQQTEVENSTERRIPIRG